MYLDASDHFCLRMHCNPYTTPIFTPLLLTGYFFGVTLHTVLISNCKSLAETGLMEWICVCMYIFRFQKKAVRIIMGSRPRDSCREMFKHLRILPLQSQYILSFLLFIVDNKNLFHVQSEINSINTRQNSHLHQPQANLTLYQKGTYYSGIKIFNISPPA